MDFSEELLSMQDPDSATGSVDVEFADTIAIVTMRCGENRLNLNFVQKLLNALEAVEKNEDIRALITVGEGKFYSNGMDLNWLMALAQENPELGFKFGEEYMSKLIFRLLTFPMPTIAALNGHCFAGGGVLSCCHDYIVMNTDKGWWCMNEVLINLRLSEFTTSLMRYSTALVRRKLGRAFHHALVMGHRFTAEEAQKYGFVLEICPLDQLIPTAKSLANSLVARQPFDRDNLKSMKLDIYQDLFSIKATRHEGGVFSKKANL